MTLDLKGHWDFTAARILLGEAGLEREVEEAAAEMRKREAEVKRERMLMFRAEQNKSYVYLVFGLDWISDPTIHVRLNSYLFLLVVPAEFFRWAIIILAGSASACFVASNVRSYIEGNDLLVVIVSALLLQIALALFIKISFFP